MTFPPKVWDGVLRRLGEEIPAFAIEAWLRPLVPVVSEDVASSASVDPSVTLLCPTTFHRDHVRGHFLANLGDGLRHELGRSVRLELELASPCTARASHPAGNGTAARRLAPSANGTGADPSGTSSANGAAAPADRSQANGAAAPADRSQANGAAAPADRSQASGTGGPGPSAAPNPGAASLRSPARSWPRAPRTVRAGAGSPAAGPRSIAEALAPIQSSLRQGPSAAQPETAPAPGATDARTGRRLGDPRAPRPALASVPARPGPRRDVSAGRSRRLAVQQRFENFVVGPCNQLGQAAAKALAQDSGAICQLYLAARTGLGKTHLARAVAIESARLGGARVRYCSAESFTNDFTAALSSRDMTGFKRRYRRECDVLIVEDVGFFDSKAQTQLEFFHTVKHVIDAGGRVVLTGPKLPRDLPGLDPSVRELLSTGFVTELEAPDEAVRREILRAKAAGGGVRLPEPCLDLLVTEVEGSIRELEGVLIQLVTTASLLGRPIDVDLTRETVEKKRGPAPHRSRPRPSPDLVIRTVSSFFKTTPEALASRSRRRDVLVPRQLAMYLCRRYTDASLGEIGRALSRDHPSVKNAVERMERQVLERAPVRYQVEALCERLDALLRDDPR